jgi:hypothetical protein
MYESGGFFIPHRIAAHTPIQIDDQDDNDDIERFCSVFVVVKGKSSFEIELRGRFPITGEIADLTEIYDGTADARNGRIILTLSLLQIDVLLDLAARIRKTAFMGQSVNNPLWHRVSARTISTLHRFVRTIKEFSSAATNLLI